MELQKVKSIIEAVIMASMHPIQLDAIKAVFGEEAVPDHDLLQAALAELAEDYADRGIELKEVATGYRFQAKQDYAEWVSRLWEEKAPRYSRALLETLVLIAYRQPITRSEIEDIRGVAVSTSIIKTLLEREWIREMGHRDVPGRPAIFGTTKQFLDYFNLKSLQDLPTLSEIKDMDKVVEEMDQQIELALEVPKAANSEYGEAEVVDLQEWIASTEEPTEALSIDAIEAIADELWQEVSEAIPESELTELMNISHETNLIEDEICEDEPEAELTE